MKNFLGRKEPKEIVSLLGWEKKGKTNPRNGHSAPDVASLVLSREEGSPPLTFWQQETVGCLCHDGVLLTDGQLLVHWSFSAGLLSS